MRRLSIVVALLLAAAALFASDETLDQLKARADKENDPKLLVQVAQKEFDLVSKAYDAGKYEEGQTALAELITYSKKAGEASRSKHKDMKRVEIALRKLAEHLEQVKRSSEFEHRAPVQDAIDKLQQERTDLLDAMFKK